jgi:hypothetical protein
MAARKAAKKKGTARGRAAIARAGKALSASKRKAAKASPAEKRKAASKAGLFAGGGKFSRESGSASGG